MKPEDTLKNTAASLQGLSASFRKAAGETETRARELERQASIAHAEASELNRKARTLEQAFLLVRNEQQSSIVSLQLDDLMKKMKKNTRIVFLIDGSGSMGMISSSSNRSYSEHSNQLQPLIAAVNAAAEISHKIIEHGGTAETLMFGDSKPLQVDLTDPVARQKVLQGLNSGTDLAPAVLELAKSVKKTQPTHIVLLSDGDLFDAKVSQPALQQLMDDNPKLTLSVIEIGRTMSTQMTDMIRSLATNGREKRIDIAQRDLHIDTNLVTLAAGQMVANRIEQQAPKKAPAKKRRTQPKP